MIFVFWPNKSWQWAQNKNMVYKQQNLCSFICSNDFYKTVPTVPQSHKRWLAKFGTSSLLPYDPSSTWSLAAMVTIWGSFQQLGSQHLNVTLMISFVWSMMTIIHWESHDITMVKPQEYIIVSSSIISQRMFIYTIHTLGINQFNHDQPLSTIIT